MTEYQKYCYEIDRKITELGNKVLMLENTLDALYGREGYAEVQKQYATAVAAYHAYLNSLL